MKLPVFPLREHAAVNPGPCTKLPRGTEVGRMDTKHRNCLPQLKAELVSIAPLLSSAKARVTDGCKDEGRREVNKSSKLSWMNRQPPTRQRTAQPLLTNVICTVADVWRNLLHTLVVQHGLLFREGAGQLLIDGPAREETPGFIAALFKKIKRNSG